MKIKNSINIRAALAVICTVVTAQDLLAQRRIGPVIVDSSFSISIDERRNCTFDGAGAVYGAQMSYIGRVEKASRSNNFVARLNHREVFSEVRQLRINGPFNSQVSRFAVSNLRLRGGGARGVESKSP